MERSFSTHPWVVQDVSGEKVMMVTTNDTAANSAHRYNIVWNPVSNSLSLMKSAASAQGGDIRRSLANSKPSHQVGRLAQARALLVQEMRELRCVAWHG